MEINLGFSPCPNDTFIFDAIVNKRIDLEGLTFKIILADVEKLNQMAFESKLDITKLSYHALALLMSEYQVLHAGSALGNHCGPLLISRGNIDLRNISSYRIGIPGKHTTANFLLHFAFPTVTNIQEYLFSDIENALLNKEIDLGLIIHENRFTYASKGLKKVIDLGEYWENETALPIPLGGIGIKRNLPKDLKIKVDKLIKKSIQYAFQHPQLSLPYIKKNAQEMDDEIVRKHIELYVNKYSEDIGDKGKEAILYLFKSINKSFEPSEVWV
jgi:1,4-dihydroxy-6-naphthoate synthase